MRTLYRNVVWFKREKETIVSIQINTCPENKDRCLKIYKQYAEKNELNIHEERENKMYEIYQSRINILSAHKIYDLKSLLIGTGTS